MGGFSLLLVAFAAVTAAALVAISPALRFAMRSLGRRVSEPEIKFLFLVLVGLGGLATAAGSRNTSAQHQCCSPLMSRVPGV